MKLKTIKLDDDRDFWLTADPHYGHRNIMKYCNRPFQTTDEMDNTLLSATNKYVKADDYLLIGGDFLMGKRDESPYEYHKRAKVIIDKINCKNLIFLEGNHDIWPDSFPVYDDLGIYYRYEKIFVSHYAHYTWNPDFKLHAYGHSHCNSEDDLNYIQPQRKSIDIGVDNAYKLLGEYRPFSFKEFLEFTKR